MTLAAAAPNAVKLIAVFQHLNGGVKSKCFRSSGCTQRLAGRTVACLLYTSTRIPYKVVYKTNFNQTPRTLADNLDPSVNRVLQATPTALGLKSGEAVTQIMFIFGTVPSGFRMVDNAYIYGTVRKSASGSSFVNKADVGGLNDSQQWIMSNEDVYKRQVQAMAI